MGPDPAGSEPFWSHPDPVKSSGFNQKCPKTKNKSKNKIVFCVEKLTFLKYNRTFLNKKQKIVHKTSVVDPDQYWIRIRNMDPDPHMQI